MMDVLWVVLLVAATGTRVGDGLPVRPTPQNYPHDASGHTSEGWSPDGGLYAAVPALALVLTAVGLLFGCTWCYRHKDCKLFTASATHLHEARRAHPPDSGFSEPANNNISEDNNNGPISLREMQNIANNNAAAYIVSENEERNRVSRESVVEFEPLPTGIRVADPLERCVDWFGGEDFPRNTLQYLREIGRGWYGRVVEGEVEDGGTTSTVAVKILNQNASLEDKARFLDENKMYRDLNHDSVLTFIAKCLQEDPWILIFELCPMDLQQYLIVNRPKMAILNESGVPLRLMCDVTSALAYLHSRGYLYGNLWCGSVLIRGNTDNARAVLGRYGSADPQYDYSAPETRRHPPAYAASSEVWCLGTLVWEVCAWGSTPTRHPPPVPDLPCPYRNHLYQVMQLCWNQNPADRPTSAQVHALINHLYTTHTEASEPSQDDGYGSSDFEERWQRLKPNTIPKLDEHIAIVHAPSTSMASHFTGSDQELENIQTVQDTLSIDMDTAISRSSSIMSDKDPLSIQIKSESLTNLHGSLEDVRNIYLTHNEMAVLECHQGNISLEESREKEHDRSDSSVDPWLKDIIAGSQDDVSYYKDVSDVIKNLDNILNSEKTSSSESSHQASPSRDNLVLDCKKDYPMQSNLVKSPGISNFQNILETGFNTNTEYKDACDDDEADRDTIGTLSHSFERHSDTISQQTLENLTPETPTKDLNDSHIFLENEKSSSICDNVLSVAHETIELPKDKEIRTSDIDNIPKLKDLCVASLPSISDNIEKSSIDEIVICDSKLELRSDNSNETKSVDNVDRVKHEYQSDFTAEKEGHIVAAEQIWPDKIMLPHEDNSDKPSTDDLENINTLVDSKVNEVEKVAAAVTIHTVCTENINDMAKLNNDELIEHISSPNMPTLDIDEEVLNKCTLIKSNIEEFEHTPKSLINFNNIKTNEHSFEVKYSEAKELVRLFLENEIINSGKHPVKVSTEMSYKNDIVPQTTLDFSAVESKNIEIPTECHTKEDRRPRVLDQCIDNVASNNILRIVNTSENIASSLIGDDNKPSETEPAASHNKNIEYLLESNIEVPLKLINNETITDLSCVENIKEKTDVEEKLLHNKQCDIEITPNAEIAQSLQKDLLHSTERINQLVSNVMELNNETNEYIINDNDDVNLLLEPTKTSQSDLNVLSNDNSVVTGSDIIEFDAKKEITRSLELMQQRQTEIPDDTNINSFMTIFETTNYEIPPSMSTEQLSSFDLSNSAKYINNDLVRANSGLEQDLMPVLPPVIVQNNDKERSLCEIDVKLDNNEDTTNNTPRSDYVVIELQEHSNDSTVYMDLINSTNSKILSDKTVVDEVEVRRDIIYSCLDSLPTDDVMAKNESTVYLDLPSIETKKETDNFLHTERINASKELESVITTSTPLGSDNSMENVLENSIKTNEPQMFSETKVPEYGPGVCLTKLEQTFVPESMSPFESPTKSHHSDTFDENSSVVLGPFENCTLDLFKGIKSAEIVDLPKEELLAFSSNFSEINLETPSPLRDVNFLNEVPDILHDDLQFDDITSVSEAKLDKLHTQNIVTGESKVSLSDPQTETNTDESGKSVTEKRVSPSTPPNSPGIFLASTSQQKYLVDIDLNPPIEAVPHPPHSQVLQDEIDLNQIELQITSKLAMAENENNLNIEYSGPLTVEGLIDEGVSDAMPESYLAGNGGSTEDLRGGLTLDEECVKALRNELELKLPLAQVAAIEPPCESEWSLELPPPPELVVSYPGALSPIAEETGQQLCAYENDTNWNTSIRTDSSESYPEPCNNSTDEATELPTGANSGPQHSQHSHNSPEQSTYTIQSKEHSPNITFTMQKEVASSKEISMSADSLNASPYKKHREVDGQSPIDDRTYNKNDDEKESNCERISQVSPFLLSPTTDTSAPDNSDNFDNATGVSTLSKTTLPTDAKLSKPSECLSKATSIDSWCSNDTLYNVEENFDDLAMDPDLPTDFVPEKEEGNSESTDTLTHNDDEKEISHCSTYIIHDSKSEACETFSPDSITANDNYTYTKIKTDAAGTTPSAITKSEMNDSSKNSQTKDLAYGTLMSGLPSYSNCTTEVGSGLDDPWKLAQPELVRRSPMGDDVNITPPNLGDDKKADSSSPQLTSEPCIKKMESVEISCLQDNFVDSQDKSAGSENQSVLIDIKESPNNHYRDYMPSVTSTPLTELDTDTENVEGIPMKLPDIKIETLECMESLPNFQIFQQSAEVRPQDLSSNVENERTNQETEILLEGDSKTLSKISNKDSLGVSERTPTYSDFESSAIIKPQDINAREKSSQSVESGISSEDFRHFENSVRNRPQDISSVIDATSLLLKSERISSEILLEGFTNDQISQSTSRLSEPGHSVDISPPNNTNLIESHSLINIREPSSTFLINFDVDDEMEQPHSIIITEAPLDVIKDNTFDSHTKADIVDLHATYDSHVHQRYPKKDVDRLSSKMNGEVNLREEYADDPKTGSSKTQSSMVNESVAQSTESSHASVSNCKPVAVIKHGPKVSGENEKYATVNFLNETFEELIESNVDDGDVKDVKSAEVPDEQQETCEHRSVNDETLPTSRDSSCERVAVKANGVADTESHRMTSVTENFLQNEKKFCQLDALFPLLSDIRFTGPATEIMSTSFTQESPTEPTSPECERDGKPNAAIDIIKEWDSDTDSHSTNSSSGEFIWKDGGGHETSVVPSTHFDHQREGGSQSGHAEGGECGECGECGDGGEGGSESGALSDGSGESGSGSEGDEVEFVPSSWDCRAAPAKSSLRSLEQAHPDNKKRVVFKRQKYHCVYEYPREAPDAADADAHSPAAYLPDFSTYADWDPTSSEEAELGYGQLFGGPSPLDLYPLRSGIAFGADYDEDFFISSSARPFESLGIMSTTSQFFPGMHAKMSILERSGELSPLPAPSLAPAPVAAPVAPPSPPPPATVLHAHTASLDFTTPDSGVEDITPGSTVSTGDDEYKVRKPTDGEIPWRPPDSGSSSESVSPSSAGGDALEALGGLRHTRDRLKLDLPPSPRAPLPSPRHNRVFNFVLDKPKRRPDATEPTEPPQHPLVMTDDTPVVTAPLPLLNDCDDLPVPEPTFSTFGKSVQKIEPEQKLILTDDLETDVEVKEESPKVVEAVKGEGTVLDSGDEDSGIESSSKATLERSKSSNVS